MAASNVAQNVPRSKPNVEVKQAKAVLEAKKFSLYWADDAARKDELEATHQVIPVFRSEDQAQGHCLPLSGETRLGSFATSRN